MPAYLLDTNIVVRLVDAGAESHPLAVRGVSGLLGSGESCFLTPQVLIEFWAVATRPTNVNGLGWKVGKTREEVDPLLDFPYWRRPLRFSLRG